MRIITVNYLPEDYDEEYIEIWLDRTVELNSLLGNFVCKEKFGEFEYIRGPLTYTMQQGITLLFNNFNQISNELLVSIVSLAREGKMTHNQKTIKASPGFKIIGILSGEKNNKSKININKLVHHIQLPTKTL
jgi:MoxR-like ATPase